MSSFRINGKMLGINTGGGGTEVVEVTAAQYEALKPACLTDGKIYKITDETGFAYASDVKYGNDTVEKRLNELNNIFIVKQYNQAIATLGAENVFFYNQTIDFIAGYTPVIYSLGVGGNQSGYVGTQCRLSATNTIFCTVGNFITSGLSNLTATLTVLYVRTDCVKQ